MNELAILAIIPAHSLDLGRVPSEARVITSGAFAAVVICPPDGGLFGRSRAQLAPWLLIGQRIVEQILACTPVLPVTFGTVADDDGAVRRILNDGRSLFEQAFATLGKRIEFDLAVRWDVQQAVREVLTDTGFAAQLAASRPEEERHVAGEELMRRVHHRRDGISRLILDTLGPLAAETIATPPSDPDLVVSVALLLEPSSVEAVENAMKAMDAAFSGKIDLDFRIVGPMAPYSFTSIHVNLPQPGEIERARTVLGVEEAAPVEEIKAAYYRIIRQVHPDIAGPTMSDKGAALAGLTEAYETLCAGHMSVSLRHHRVA